MTFSREKAQSTIQLDNDRVIVTEWRFPPGAETGWHRHMYDYIVVPQNTGDLLIETAGGEVKSSLVTGQSYARDEGVEHNVINCNDYEFVFVEIELK